MWRDVMSFRWGLEFCLDGMLCDVFSVRLGLVSNHDVVCSFREEYFGVRYVSRRGC